MYCQAIDIRDSLFLDAASIQVELAMHLKKSHIRFQELSQLCISIDKASQAAWLIKSHSDARKHPINFFLLEFARPDHPRASQLLSCCELQDRLKKSRMFMERTAEARQASNASVRLEGDHAQVNIPQGCSGPRAFLPTVPLGLKSSDFGILDTFNQSTLQIESLLYSATITQILTRSFSFVIEANHMNQYSGAMDGWEPFFEADISSSPAQTWMWYMSHPLAKIKQCSFDATSVTQMTTHFSGPSHTSAQPVTMAQSRAGQNMMTEGISCGGILTRQICQGLSCLERLPMDFTQLKFCVAEVQRAFLELTAGLDYLYIYKPRMDGILPPATETAQTIGVFTMDSTILQEFTRAGLPVWFMRPAHTLPGVRVNSIVETRKPNEFLELREAETKFDTVFCGSADDPKKRRAIVQYFTLPGLFHMDWMESILPPGGFHGMADGFHGMVDGIHTFSRWNPYFG
ncbi:uncharacterized protein LACBIDRAFT_333848 [Laccaria bicolor S238N-H82]|uniref:Predicted protein n=1 Tax=Laccaria bicolor (strain S238N-H82 / ATCC MYA-4686) TaxID=486041 RepID=B0DX99_LACBS|nr:uncharacterized protein LACBIDRAFT_333848 [Laccaria bicolor S238N-H82]EDR00757.1 predicted protein [Laccaria bicolor S238N-H82]|eukprot:XP_001888549.1 predicted protein [Laccaria bicolor S238N-H82]